MKRRQKFIYFGSTAAIWLVPPTLTITVPCVIAINQQLPAYNKFLGATKLDRLIVPLVALLIGAPPRAQLPQHARVPRSVCIKFHYRLRIVASLRKMKKIQNIVLLGRSIANIVLSCIPSLGDDREYLSIIETILTSKLSFDNAHNSILGNRNIGISLSNRGHSFRLLTLRRSIR